MAYPIPPNGIPLHDQTGIFLEWINRSTNEFHNFSPTFFKLVAVYPV